MVSLNLCPAPVFPWIFLKFQLKQLKVLLEKATFEILKKSIKKKINLVTFTEEILNGKLHF